MNTKQIIKEWKNFLKEAKEPKFTKENIGKEAVYSPCCEVCVSFLKMKKGTKKYGKITAVDGKNVKISDREENTVFIDKKMVPQCCVTLK